ncbi:MAG TPA: CAAX prenyl protease-related protein [Bryobacteraceae bacterium]|nr:CAAX prenyl protease-related protein [Bryobacteraceae bacterium]
MPDKSLREATIAYVAPFLAYILMFAVPLRPELLHPIRFVIVLAVILIFSRKYLSLKPSHSLGSIGVGIAVFLVWIAPDLLIPGYRHFWLFENALLGKVSSSLSPDLRHDYFFLTIRVLSSVALVPILEELFWRGWLMRWLINNRDFLKVPLGAYQAAAFWIVALLFASEHGVYWEVGLAAGIVYNWWIVRTKNLADCILAHAITNGILAAYVLISGQWQYWL